MPDFLSILDNGLVPLKKELPAGHSRHWIHPGPEGTKETIEPMVRLVNQAKLELMQDTVTSAKRTYKLRSTIRKIIDSCPPKDYYCYAKALYEFCRDQIKYAFDPVGVELIEHPEHVLEAGIADCDSNAILLATMYEAIGLPARFVTVKGDPRHPDEYSHVFVEVKIPRMGWVGADPIMPDKQFGWEPDRDLPRKNWPASKDSEPSGDQDDGVKGMQGFGNFETAQYAADAGKGALVGGIIGLLLKHPVAGAALGAVGGIFVARQKMSGSPLMTPKLPYEAVNYGSRK